MSAGDGHNETKADKLREGAPSFAFSIFNHEPWSQLSGNEIEWVSGLSHGRKF